MHYESFIRHSRPAIFAVGFYSADNPIEFRRGCVCVESFSTQEIVEAIVKAYLLRLTTFTSCRIFHLILDDLAILTPVIQIHRAPESNFNNLFSWASRNTVDKFLGRGICTRSVANKMRRDLDKNAKQRNIVRSSGLSDR
jgi:hypothetical protein